MNDRDQKFLQLVADLRFNPDFRHLMEVLVPELYSYGPGGINYNQLLPMEARADLWFEKLVPLADMCHKLVLSPQCYPALYQRPIDYSLTAEYHSCSKNRARLHKYWLQRMALLGWVPKMKRYAYPKREDTHAWQMHKRAFMRMVQLRYGKPKDDTYSLGNCD